MVNSIKDLLEDSMYSAPNYSAGDIIVSLMITIILTLFVYWVYKKTYSGVIYSKNYNVSLVMIAVIISILMRAISGNLALSLGMVGALSIIRFRTAIKDPKDVSFLFWAVAIGISTGVGLYQLSIISTLFLGAFILISAKYFVYEEQHLLVINGKKINKSKLLDVIKTYTKRYNIRSESTSGGSNEFSIEVKLKNKIHTKFVSDLENVSGVIKVLIFSHEGDLME